MRLEIYRLFLSIFLINGTRLCECSVWGTVRSALRWQRHFFVGDNRFAPRGGSHGSESGHGHGHSYDESDSGTHTDAMLSSRTPLGYVGSSHCVELLLDLRRRTTAGDNDESLDLRRLIATRTSEYLEDLRESSIGSSGEHKQKHPHPRKLLHFLAPKVPAIKHSPDVNLRIHSAQSDIDSGVAACIINTVAHACDMYARQQACDGQAATSMNSPSAAIEIINDRRFEQLIECVLSGVNVEKRNREALRYRMKKQGEEEEDIEELLDDSNLEESDGLSSRDACRAAWGIAMLGAHHLEELGGEKVLELLQALSLRIRELLLARLKLLTQDDLLSEVAHAVLTVEERIHELAGELAEDATLAMWTFACVKACTGLQSVRLFETCSSILCQNPFDLRRRAQEIDHKIGGKIVGNNDIVDRLARVESGIVQQEESPRNTVGASALQMADKDVLLDWLSKTQLNDVMWALAIHGRDDTNTSTDDTKLSETASTLGEIAFDRLIEGLEQDPRAEERDNENDGQVIERNNATTIGGQGTMTVEVVDAAILLATQDQSSPALGGEVIKKLPVESMTLRGTNFSDRK